MGFNVWWLCPIHNRWEMDCEGLTWDEAVEAAKRIALMTGQLTAIGGREKDDLPVVQSSDASTQG